MKEQFLHSLVSGFYLWLEYVLLDKLEAYYPEVQNKFKFLEKTRFASEDYSCYQGICRQIPAENSLSNSLSGFYVNSNFVPIDNDSGIFLDYDNGRVFTPKNLGENLNITGSFPMKEINTYLSYDREEDLLLHSDFVSLEENESWLFSKEKKLNLNTYLLPACFILFDRQENKPFAFGGMEDSQTVIKVIVVTQDQFALQSVLSRLADSARSSFPLVPINSFPYGKNSFLKNYPYSYETLVEEIKSEENQCAFIEDVQTYMLKGDLKNQVAKKTLSIGFAEFNLSSHRFPRL